MSNRWTPVDVDLLRDPAMRAAGRDAALLYVAALCHCTQQLTDGFVDEGMVAVLAAEAWSNPRTAPKALEEHGLWERVEGGWQIAAWFDHNDSSEELRRQREAETERKRRWRERKKAEASPASRDTPRDASRPTSRDAPRDATRDTRRDTPRDAPIPSTYTDTPPYPPKGGSVDNSRLDEDPRVGQAITQAAASSSSLRARPRREAELRDRFAERVAGWIERWPAIAVDQLVAGITADGRLPQSVQYLEEAPPRPELRAVE